MYAVVPKTGCAAAIRTGRRRRGAEGPGLEPARLSAGRYWLLVVGLLVRCARRSEALRCAVDTQRELPRGLRKRQDGRWPLAVLVHARQDEQEREDQEGSADQTQQRQPPGHEARRVHEVAEQQPVADAGHESRPPFERPLVGVREAVTLDLEGDRLAAARPVHRADD